MTINIVYTARNREDVRHESNAVRRGMTMNSLRHIRLFQMLNIQGQALVELALLLPIFLVFILGSIEFGRAFYLKNKAINAAREGARAAVVSLPSDYTTYYITKVHGVIAPGSIRRLEIEPETSTLLTKGIPVTVKVNVKFESIVPNFKFKRFDGKPDFTFTIISSVTGSATMRYEGL